MPKVINSLHSKESKIKAKWAVDHHPREKDCYEEFHKNYKTCFICYATCVHNNRDCFLYRLLIKLNRAFPEKMHNLLQRKTLSLILNRSSWTPHAKQALRSRTNKRYSYGLSCLNRLGNSS